MEHELVHLADAIDWDAVEVEFKDYFAELGRHGVPIHKMNSEQLKVYLDDLMLYSRVLTQKRTDSNKIYSLHEPDVQCIAKGKEHKPYEFGNKSSIAKTKTGVIMGAMAFKGNPFDGHTLPEQPDQIRRLSGMTVKNAFVDRGYRCRK